jgi:Co/Zn/Cd efflux system component
MSIGRDCCEVGGVAADDRRFRKVLWIALAINAAMFGIEAVAGLRAGSVALQADSLDFFGDAANYAIGLFVLARTLRWRATAALIKGATMAVFGVWILGMASYKAFVLGAPSAMVMGTVGILAMFANIVCAAILYRFRDGESNRRSVWICSRNDALGNVAVVLAASGVFVTGTAWPDLFVGVVMAVLALAGARQIIAQARAELGTVTAAVTP